MGTKIQISVLPRPKRALHQQYLAEAPLEEEPVQEPQRGLYPGEPLNCRRSLRPFLRNLAFLGLLLIVFAGALPSHVGAHAGQEFGGAKGLFDIVVGA